MKNKPALPEGLQIVAIIHIDTVGSRELYKDVSPLEKARCAKLLKEFFEGIIKKYRGTLSKWEGDGGFALFPFSNAEQIENVFGAGKTVIEELPHLNAQTAKILNRESFPRHVVSKLIRVKLF
jgi:class 3 adenylate cyclase